MGKKLDLMRFGVIVSLLSISSSGFAQQESGRFSIGVRSGYAISIADGAVIGTSARYPATEFTAARVYGGSIMYRLPSGYALEVCIERFSMDLKEFGENLGVLNRNLVMFLLNINGLFITKKDTKLTSYGNIGAGIDFTSFDKGPYIIAREKRYNVIYNITTKNSLVFEIGGGINYFFTKRFSINLEGRLLLETIDTSGWWTDIKEFQGNNLQLLFGIRFLQ